MSQDKADHVKVNFSRSDPEGEGSVMVFEMTSCGGCSTCELACSFHHTGEFSTRGSSLRIMDKEGEEGCRVRLILKSDGEGNVCDGCKDLDVPLCMEYCRESDDLGRILQAFEAEKERKKIHDEVFRRGLQ